jgi:hypothetical protein
MHEACEEILFSLSSGPKPVVSHVHKDSFMRAHQKEYEDFVYVLRFLLSVTFRDLSIMVNLHICQKKPTDPHHPPLFHPTDDISVFLSPDFHKIGGSHHHEPKTSPIFYKVHLIDIKPKNFAKPESFHSQEKELLLEYLEHCYKNESNKEHGKSPSH